MQRAALVLVLVAGCYRPAAELSCEVRCGPDGSCPGDFGCQGGFCVAPGFAGAQLYDYDTVANVTRHRSR